MEVDLLAWTNLAVRWLHFVAGISWIGASFYFVWLDNSLRAAPSMRAGVKGELWAVHGGGFYHNEKFVVAPPELPEHLHWFKWEAYTTWLSGFALLIIVYYVSADLYLIDRAKADLSRSAAIATGLGVLIVGWLIYDALCRSPIGKDERIFGAIWFLLLVATTYGLTRVFSDKGAFMHTGALIGTVMVANVLLVIIPNQKKAVAAMIAGKTPDPALGAAAKQRSVHNNYMTLPVLLIMISGHYSMLVGHRFNWLLLAGFAAASVMARHFFNLRHKGSEQRALIVGAGVLFVATVLVASIKPASAVAPHAAASKIGDTTIVALTTKHCSTCHSANPTHPAFSAPPLGLILEDLD
ncbi:MAG: urate hydroxylase PuuD [Parvularculaceae bacterium]